MHHVMHKVTGKSSNMSSMCLFYPIVDKSIQKCVTLALKQVIYKVTSN